MENIYEILGFMQKEIHVPKKHHNKFGNFYYRNCEDILEGVKKVMPKGVSLLLNDEILMSGDRFYVKSVVSLHYKDQKVESQAFAREPSEKVKFDVSQLTGSSSSYARKYALSGLFLLDDCKDADTSNNGNEETKTTILVSSSPSVGSKDKVSKDNLERIFYLAKKLNVSSETGKKWLSHFKVSSFEDLSFSDSIALLKKLDGMSEKLDS